MNRLDRQMFPFDHTLHVHQTGTVGSGDKLGSGTHMILYFIVSHANRYFRFFDSEHATETAAFVDALRLQHLNAFHQLQQVTQLGK